MKITNLKKSGSSKYIALVDGQKWTFYDEVLLEFKIFKDTEISAQIFEKMSEYNHNIDAYYKILKYINSKMRTQKEVEDKLKSLNIAKNEIEKIVSRLKNEGYLDRKKYINSYINDAVLLTLNGPGKIRSNLENLGFTLEEINASLDNIPSQVWDEKVQKIILKKQKSNHKYSAKMLEIKIKKELINFGYPSNTTFKVSKVDDKILEKEYAKIYRKLSKKYAGATLDYMVKQKLFSLGFDLNNLEDIKKVYNENL